MYKKLVRMDGVLTAVAMTDSEEALLRAEMENIPAPEQTPEERLDALETTTDDMILLMAELIGGE